MTRDSRAPRGSRSHVAYITPSSIVSPITNNGQRWMPPVPIDKYEVHKDPLWEASILTQPFYRELDFATLRNAQLVSLFSPN